MRIITGEFKGRRLAGPRDNSTTRPMPDRVKESLFSILRGRFEGARVLDAFAGTGALGLETVSRGAAECVFVEREKEAVSVLEANIAHLGCADRCTVVKGDALGAGMLARCPRPVDLVFFDPPYPLVMDRVGWRRVKAQFEAVIAMLADDGIAVLRTPWPFRHRTDDATDTTPVVARDAAKSARPRDNRRAGRKPRDAAGGWERPKGRWWEEEPAKPELRLKGKRGRELRLDDLMTLSDWEAREAAADASSEQAEPTEHAAPIDAPATGAPVHTAAAPAPTEEVDLRMHAAVGPETHVYRHSAIHLYMRQKSPD